MSKAQTDIRSISYDVWNARPYGYEGTIDDALAQINTELSLRPAISVRESLLMYLGVDRIPSAGPSVEMDDSPRYGEPQL